mmetsp:Transcript_16812/g.24599  ORF Transcript_16812/g.24599 Transcript_16812/m.24599 type:complete len:338 (-) Transcript_16812:60-1073(-)
MFCRSRDLKEASRIRRVRAAPMSPNSHSWKKMARAAATPIKQNHPEYTAALSRRSALHASAPAASNSQLSCTVEQIEANVARSVSSEMLFSGTRSHPYTVSLRVAFTALQPMATKSMGVHWKNMASMSEKRIANTGSTAPLSAAIKHARISLNHSQPFLKDIANSRWFHSAILACCCFFCSLASFLSSSGDFSFSWGSAMSSSTSFVSVLADLLGLSPLLLEVLSLSACRRASSAYVPSDAANSSCVPHSIIVPASITMIWFALRTVDRRWAIMIVVRLSMRLSSASCTMRSLCVSRAEVASSSSKMVGLRSRARAMATRCFWPPDSWMPWSPTLVS